MTNKEKVPLRRFTVLLLRSWFEGQESLLLTKSGSLPMFGHAESPPPAVMLTVAAPSLCGSEILHTRIVGEVESVVSSLTFVSGTVVNPALNGPHHELRWHPISHMMHRGTFTDLVVSFLRSDIEGYRLTETPGRGWWLTFPPPAPNVSEEKHDEREGGKEVPKDPQEPVSAGGGSQDSTDHREEAQVQVGPDPVE